jgi:hypothetical protein
VWNGPGDWTVPRGDLAILIVDEAGRPQPEVRVFLEPKYVRVPNASEAWSSDADGRLTIRDLPAAPYLVRAVELRDRTLTTLGEAAVSVPGGDTATVRLLVRARP